MNGRNAHLEENSSPIASGTSTRRPELHVRLRVLRADGLLDEVEGPRWHALAERAVSATVSR